MNKDKTNEYKYQKSPFQYKEHDFEVVDHPKAYCPFRTWRRKVKSLHGRLILKIGSTTKYLSFLEDSMLLL